MTRAAAYYRVSTDMQAANDRHSLAAQREAFARHCTEHGYETAGEFEDVESGRKIERVAYQRMLEAARGGRIDVIVVSFLDRFGRDQWEVMRSLGELRSLGVAVEAVYEDTSEFVMVALSAWKAEQESRRLGERVRVAGQRAVRQGIALGTAPFGYLKQNAKLIPDPIFAPVVAGIFRAYVDDNLSMNQIAQDLNARDVRRPRAHEGTVDVLLGEPAQAIEAELPGWGLLDESQRGHIRELVTMLAAAHAQMDALPAPAQRGRSAAEIVAARAQIARSEPRSEEPSARARRPKRA